jgi:hypothetical protein
MPGLLDALGDVPAEECPLEPVDYLDDRLGETGAGTAISDAERG